MPGGSFRRDGDLPRRLASIPKEVDDAAAIDGATGLRKFWSVSLPLQLPIATVALLFGIVFTATDMAVVYILTTAARRLPTPPRWSRPGVQDRDRIRLARRGRCDLSVPLTCPRARRDRDADLRAPRGGDLAMDAVVRGSARKGCRT